MSEEENAKPNSIDATIEGGAEKWVEDFQRTVKSSTDSALVAARSLRHESSFHLRSLKDYFPHAVAQYKTYEDTFFKTITAELMGVKEHPAAAVGLGVATAFLLMRGPRRLLIRNTLGRLRSEEALFTRTEKEVEQLNISVEVMRNESSKLLQRAALAENEMSRGHAELMKSGRQIQGLANSTHKVEAKATDLMDELREIPGRDALKLRAEVASMTSLLKEQKNALNKRMMKMSDLGVAV